MTFQSMYGGSYSVLMKDLAQFFFTFISNILNIKMMVVNASGSKFLLWFSISFRQILNSFSVPADKHLVGMYSEENSYRQDRIWKVKTCSMKCNCKPGFTGKYCEIEVNECKESKPCQNGAGNAQTSQRIPKRTLIAWPNR